MELIKYKWILPNLYCGIEVLMELDQVSFF